MSKNKIAFVIPELNLGGAQRVVTSLANTLIDDYEIFIISFIDTKSFYKLDDRIVFLNCVDTIKPSSNFIDAIRSNSILIKRINTIVRKNKIELLISFLTSANILSTIVGKLNKLPVIISERNNPYSERTPKIWQFMRSLTYPKANFVVVQTEIIKSYYVNQIKENRLVILPNPISKELTVQRNCDIQKENIILNAGRLTDQKAQHVLINAFARTKNNNWKLIIAGDGSKREDYEQLIKKLHLNEKVFLIGQEKEIHSLYNKTKIFAFSSIYEGFPNALIEAMHFGLACVSTDCPTGPSELITDGKNGYLVPMNDEMAMAEKLNILMNDDKKCQVFGELASKTVEKFEVENVATQWQKIIATCLD